MKSSARNFSNNLGRNRGQGKRTPKVMEQELNKSVLMYNKVFDVNAEQAYLYKFSTQGRKCSHLKWTATHDEDFAESDDFEAPVIVIEQDEDESILDETLEMLQEPKDICPVCYGSGIVGNYRVVNSFEVYLDTTYEPVEMNQVIIEQGKPFYFRPISRNAYIIFKVNLPAFFETFEKITEISKSEKKHIPYSSYFQIAHANESFVYFDSIDLKSYLQYDPCVYLKFFIKEDTHGFFMRFLNGKNYIGVSFPNVSKEIEEGESDYYDSVTVSVDSTENITTFDVIKEMYNNRYWRVTSIEPKIGLRKDLGKDIGLKRVRGFERHALLP